LEAKIERVWGRTWRPFSFEIREVLEGGWLAGSQLGGNQTWVCRSRGSRIRRWHSIWWCLFGRFNHTAFPLLRVWQPITPLHLGPGRLDGGATLLLPVVLFNLFVNSPLWKCRRLGFPRSARRCKVGDLMGVGDSRPWDDAVLAVYCTWCML
jgi:hypothetical protein